MTGVPTGSQSLSQFVEVASADDLAEATPTTVRVRGREIAVVKWRGKVFALRNICAHMTARLSAGWIQAELVQGQNIYDIEADDDNPVVRCPWHGFRFHLKDGTCTKDPKLRVRSYDVVVENGRVFVDLGRQQIPANEGGEP